MVITLCSGGIMALLAVLFILLFYRATDLQSASFSNHEFQAPLKG
jgi:hypothetical protein